MTVCSQVAGVPDALHGPAVVGPDGIHPLDAGQTGHDGTGVDIQRQQRRRDQIGLLLVAGLGAGVQHHGQQRTDRQHDSGDREQEGRLANGHSLRPPSQQPERDDEDGEQENVAGQFKDRDPQLHRYAPPLHLDRTTFFRPLHLPFTHETPPFTQNCPI